MELSSSNIKKILIFSQKKAFLKFPEMEPSKISHASGNGNPEKFLIFSQEKTFLIFQETETPKRKL